MRRKTIIKNNKISEIVYVELKGYNQKILIEGKDINLPIMINLHGGPGMPVPFNGGSRGLFPLYTDKFIMVYWDQLGCGLNRNKIASSLSVSDYVQMTIDLVIYIKNRFKNNKIFFCAISFGTVLSALSLSEIPNLVDGVLAWGQFVSNPWINEDIIIQMKNNKASNKEIDFIKSINSTNLNIKSLKKMYKLLNKKTKGYRNKDVPQMPVAKLAVGYLFGSDYSLKEYMTLMSNPLMTNVEIYKYLLDIDLTNTLKNISVPYHIYTGEYDVICAPKIAFDNLGNLNNSNLKITIVGKCSHLPSKYEYDRIPEYLSDLTNI